MGMADLELKDIFEKERFPKSNWQFISLVFYFPFGLVCALLRIFIGVNACLAALLFTQAPIIRSFVLRFMYFILGVAVEEEDKQLYDKSNRVLVANCVTHLDHVALHLVTNCITPNRWKASFLTTLVPGIAQLGDVALNVNNLRSIVEKGDVPLLLHPEGTTSGKKALLKFGVIGAQVSRRVQPVAVSVHRPTWANTAPTVLGASFTSDLFWFLFSPYTYFTIRYLNVLQRESEETDEAFTDRMQGVIANTLSLPVSTFTASDKAEYEKRYLDDLNRPVLVSPPGIQMRNPELLRMTSQVTEVLPHVPQEAILKDLNRTWSVETTISNILEGVVQFTPVSETEASSTQSRTSISNCSHPSSSNEDSGGSRNSQDRMLSFSERKAKMIEEARQRYLEKKGLQGLL